MGILRRQERKQQGNGSAPTASPLTPSLAQSLAALRTAFGESTDFIIREMDSSQGGGAAYAVCYMDGLVDQEMLTSLMEGLLGPDTEGTVAADQLESMLKRRIPAGSILKVQTQEKLFSVILEGFAAVLCDGLPLAIAASIQGGARRAVEEPSSQTVIRGPKEGFTEELNTNMALLRRKLRTPALRILTRTIGEYSNTRVAVAYVHGIADSEVLEEVSRRLDSIRTDGILESGYIEEFIQDAPLTPFPLMLNTERPDTAAGCLLDGQVAILVDGTPFALIAPVTFFKFFQSSEDYYQRYDIATFLRLIRFSSFLVSLLLPSIYIAVTTFHQEMLPTTLLISLAAQREGTPLPALLEALLMELTFEVIREAGVRMPRVIGPAISIVGALVLGQSAVQAGLVSGAMVIVVSFTAISNFVLPAFNMAASVRLLRFGLMFLAGTFGLFGILAGLIPILVHLVSLRSFGIPYFLPYAPFHWSNQKDVFIRAPWWSMKIRPSLLSKRNRVRQATPQFPEDEERWSDNRK